MVSQEDALELIAGSDDLDPQYKIAVVTFVNTIFAYGMELARFRRDNVTQFDVSIISNDCQYNTIKIFKAHEKVHVGYAGEKKMVINPFDDESNIIWKLRWFVHGQTPPRRVL